ncbi:1-acyl-sn-glycerol-3-phosphate acyltransferase [Bacillus sp. JZ8]
MIRTIYIGGYSLSSLFFSLSELNRVRNLPPLMSPAKRDKEVHDKPKKWGRKVIELTGSKVEVNKKEKLLDEPVLFVSNYQGPYDIPALLGYIQKPFGFFSKQKFENYPLWNQWMNSMHCVLMDRNDSARMKEAYRTGIHLLTQGHSLLVFAERKEKGSKDLHHLNGEDLSMAVEAGVPIVPVSIDGTKEIDEQGTFRIRPSTLSVHIGSPIREHLDDTITKPQLIKKVEEALQGGLLKEDAEKEDQS